MNGKKGLAAAFTALFLLLCLLPSAGMLLWGASDPVANEIPAAAPSLRERDGSVNGQFLEDFADCMNGRFAFRPEYITAWAKLNAALLGTSTAEDVLLGSDGWLYYAPTLDDYTGSALMTEREIWCAGRTLYLLQEYVQSRDGTFLFTIAPNKNSLYPEHMPQRTPLSAQRNAGELAEVLEEMGVTYLDLFSLLGGQEETLYFRGDSHWNGRGAALAADSILEALGRPSPGFYNGPFRGEQTHRGDLYEMLYPAGDELETDYLYAPGLQFEYTSSSTDPDSITLATESPDGEGGLLLYRDSFGRNLYPYLADQFAQAVFSRKNDYSPVSMEPGDCVVVELVERNLRYLNQYSPTMPAPERPAETAAGAREGNGEVEVTVSSCALEGYVLVTGIFRGLLPQSDSSVYVLSGGTLYEAFPTPDGFSLCLPGTADSFAATAVFFTAEGNLVQLSAVQ